MVIRNDSPRLRAIANFPSMEKPPLQARNQDPTFPRTLFDTVDEEHLVRSQEQKIGEIDKNGKAVDFKANAFLTLGPVRRSQN